jgi:hypothetical protein
VKYLYITDDTPEHCKSFLILRRLPNARPYQAQYV